MGFPALPFRYEIDCVICGEKATVNNPRRQVCFTVKCIIANQKRREMLQRQRYAASHPEWGKYTPIPKDQQKKRGPKARYKSDVSLTSYGSRVDESVTRALAWEEAGGKRR